MIYLLLTLASAFANPEINYPFASFIPVQNERQVYVEHRPAQNDRPTLVLINGLTYSTTQWDDFVGEVLLRDPDVGILRFDMQGQGETLLNYAENYSNNPFYEQHELPYPMQVDNMNAVLDRFQIPANKLYLVGLSYGGAIAMNYLVQYPEKVHSVALLAPFTASLKAVDEWVKKQMELVRLNPFNPLNAMDDEELYEHFLKIYVYTFFPVVEPIVLENPFKLEASYRLTSGVRKFKAVDIADQFKPKSVHLIVGEEDEYIGQEEFMGFWSSVPESAKMSYTTFSNTKHKLPEELPYYTAQWILKIINGDPELTGGNEIFVDIEE